MSRRGRAFDAPLLFMVLLLFVVLPLLRFAQGPAAETLRAVDFVSLYASGIAAGALLATLAGRLRSARRMASGSAGETPSAG